jgi:hypothetical protein
MAEQAVVFNSIDMHSHSGSLVTHMVEQATCIWLTMKDLGRQHSDWKRKADVLDAWDDPDLGWIEGEVQWPTKKKKKKKENKKAGHLP